MPRTRKTPTLQRRASATRLLGNCQYSWSAYGKEYQAWAAEQVSLSLQRHLTAMMDNERAARSGETSYDFPAHQPHHPFPGSSASARSFLESDWSRGAARGASESSLSRVPSAESSCSLAALEAPVKRKSRSTRILGRLKKFLF